MDGFTAQWSEVVPGVFRLGVARVNCYLVVDEDGLTLVDAGLPGTRRALRSVLEHLGATIEDIEAIMFTHGHFDHVGMARGLQRTSMRMLVHPGDRRLLRHPYRYARESSPLVYPLRYPRTVPGLLAMTWNRALFVGGVAATAELRHGEPAEVPGRPTVLWTPGHTNGHCGFFFERPGVLFTGDALVTLDPYTGERGPRIIAGAATADSDRALQSLDVFAEPDARMLLPGHGEPWTGGAAVAIERARAAGRR
ncbi:MBL fold metallo-hydrolase [Microbacterium sp.]|uniref:MBL fold metallo-hydrolase n=1 Tax=Microbacterium sp. TaxID=51671 RepID=UPI0028121D19|nr:MBL fold metallo-hydrolase [Microbacterium sp.]